MTLITRGQRLYFTAVGIFALWVGVWGYFFPAHVDGAIPWPVPPLHARFLGAMYLSGTAFMLGCILAQRYVEVSVVVPMIAIWTGMLFVVSLFHLGEFDFTRQQTWAWFGTYLVFPLIAIWLAWRHRADWNGAHHMRLPAWARGYLFTQGCAVTLLGLVLLVAPKHMVALWPWPIIPLLAQIYSAPLLSYGVGSLLLATRRSWPEVRVAVVAMFVFSAGVLIASLIHRALFAAAGLSAWIWFGGFVVASGMLGLLIVRELQGRLRWIASPSARS
jgi:hypothetical protein